MASFPRICRSPNLKAEQAFSTLSFFSFPSTKVSQRSTMPRWAGKKGARLPNFPLSPRVDDSRCGEACGVHVGRGRAGSRMAPTGERCALFAIRFSGPLRGHPLVAIWLFLDALWAPFGPFWAPFGIHFDRFCDTFGPFGPFLDPFGLHFGTLLGANLA